MARSVGFEPTLSEVEFQWPSLSPRAHRGGLGKSRTCSVSGFKPDAFTDFATSPKDWTEAFLIGGANGVESNPRPPAYKAGALPTELRRRHSFVFGYPCHEL